MEIDFAPGIGANGVADDSVQTRLRIDNWNSLMVGQNGPKYLEWVRRGLVFTARPTNAAALVIFSTATNAPTLWNPLGSGKLIVPIRLQLHPVAIASAVHTGVLLGFKANCGANAGTGAPFPTFTEKAPTNNCPATGKTSLAKFADNVVTFTTIPAIFQDIGMYQAAAGLPTPPSYDFDGTVALGPGDAMSVLAQAASVNTYWMSIIFAELPLVAGGLS